MFNRKEQSALLLLAGILLLGSGLSVVDRYRSSTLEEFQVVSGAVQPPAAVQVESLAVEVQPGRLDLNVATAAQLQQLPAIGPKTAARILAYRQQHGPFATLEDLEKVPGIGPRTIEKLRPLVACGEEPRP